MRAGTRVLAFGEDSRAQASTSELVDLRAANANLIPRRSARRASFEATSAAANAKRTPSGTRVLALRRGFFATPLVSELPDGLGSNANLIFAHNVRKKLGENLPVPQPTQKGHPIGCPFTLCLATEIDDIVNVE